ncbi:MAG: hypothetical protein P4L53_09220 [Candidatus Obscuribacterales bacterium]|nr:hypothetical protein [Candidatus Obscuribacterales bacterium]
MYSRLQQFETCFTTFTGQDFFVVLFYMALAFVVAVIFFVANELLNYNLTNLVPHTVDQAREHHNRLKDRIGSARTNRSPAFDYDFGDKLLLAVTLCLDDADRKVARAPSHIKSYKEAWKDVKLALRQLREVEALFDYVPNED